MNVRVREYTAHDLAPCLAIFDSNVPEFFTAPERPLFEGFLEDLPGPYFVLEDAGAIVACGGYAISPETGCADLCWGMVLRTRQREGLGRFLTEQRLGRIAADPRVAEIALRTSHLTRAFYEQHGFVTEDVVPAGIAPGLDLCVMRLRFDHTTQRGRLTRV